MTIKTFNPVIAFYLQSQEAATILEHFRYFIERGGYGKMFKGRNYIHNTLESLKDQFPYYTTWEIRKALKILRDEGIFLTEKLDLWRHNHRLYYTIDYDQLYKITGVDYRSKQKSNKTLKSARDSQQADLRDSQALIHDNTISKNPNSCLFVNSDRLDAVDESKDDVCSDDKQKEKKTDEEKGSKNKESDESGSDTIPSPDHKQNHKQNLDKNPTKADNCFLNPQTPPSPPLTPQPEAKNKRINIEYCPLLKRLVKGLNQLGVKLNRYLVKLINKIGDSFEGESVIADAIASLKQQVPDNPTGFLIAAIKGKFKPNFPCQGKGFGGNQNQEQTTMQQRSYDPNLGINPPQWQLNRQQRYQMATYMLYYPWGDQCPWNSQNKLDPKFVEFMANKWLTHSKTNNSYRWKLNDLSQAKSAFRSSCAKDPHLMDSYWLEYQDAIAKVVERIQLAVCDRKHPKLEDLKILKEHQRAVIYRLPDECPDSLAQEDNASKGLLLSQEQLEELFRLVEGLDEQPEQQNNSNPTPEQPSEQTSEQRSPEPASQGFSIKFKIPKIDPNSDNVPFPL